MKKVLIIGCGKSGERFLRANALREDIKITITSNTIEGNSYKNSLFYDVEYCLYQDINFLEYELIILSVPIMEKNKLLNEIVVAKYKGRILFEKPLSISSSSSNEITEAIRANQIVSLIMSDCLINYV